MIAVGPRDSGELAAAGVRSLDGQLGALIRPAGLTAGGCAAAAGAPAPWWLHTGLDVLATTELAAVDYPQPGGLTWTQLDGITSAAWPRTAAPAGRPATTTPDLNPGRDGADAIISHLTRAITTADREHGAQTRRGVMP